MNKKRRITIAGMVVAVCAGMCLLNSAIKAEADTALPYEEGEVLLVLDSSIQKEVSEELLQPEAVSPILTGADGDVVCAVVALDDVSDNSVPTDVREAVEYYSEQPGVLYAQPNYTYEPETDVYSDLETEAAESRAGFGQWYWSALFMEQTRAYLEKANAGKIRVAVIDTGVDIGHPDLDTVINMTYSKNVCGDTYKPVTGDAGSNSHGTMVTGIIAADADNDIGMAGIASGYADVCMLQVQEAGGSISTKNAIRAIQYAKSIDSRIINMSLGIYREDLALGDALESAAKVGVLIVCSAGNNSTDQPHYPSKYPFTLGVIASGKNNTRYGSSNYGSDNFISAPGQEIYTTVAGGGYRTASGSSMAAAVVSGVAADIWACDPSMSADEVKNILASTATDIYSEGFDADSGWGIVNPLLAVRKVTGFTKYDLDIDIPNTTDGFVERLYYYCLRRDSDSAGKSTWTGVLNRKEKNGGEVAYGFLFSDEFLHKNLSDEQYIDILYRVFLNRKADSAGKASWMKALDEGVSRLYVMNGFSGSKEFGEICNNCGILSGQVRTTENRDINQGYTAYVARLYRQALGRGYDIPGLNNWAGLLNSKKWTAYQVATQGFFHSSEFTNKNLSNEDFVKILYRTFLDREYDQAGLTDWIHALNSGKSRDEVIAGFANSKEFGELMAGYGL